MATIQKLQIGNGQVAFVTKVDPTPTTSETSGSVTINNIGRPGKPAHYEITFSISVDSLEGRVEGYNTFLWNEIVLDERDDVPYREVEAKAARQIAPMLRAVADQVEKEVAAFDARPQTGPDTEKGKR